MNMTKNKDISNRIQTGESTLSIGNAQAQVFSEYMLAPDLPQSIKKRQVCISHINDGAASELASDFEMGGVRFPERDEPQEITTQFSCKGVSCILRKCGLQITQYDSNGAEVGKMGA